MSDDTSNEVTKGTNSYLDSAPAAEETSAPVVKNPSEEVKETESQVEKPEVVSEPEEEKITLTQKELDARSAKIRAITERRAKREAEADYKVELEKMQQQQPAAQNGQPNSYAQVPPGYVWDDVLGSIPENTTRQQYSLMIAQALASQPAQPQTAKPAPSAPSAPAEEDVTKDAKDQFENCLIEMDDAESLLGSSAFNSKMFNAAADVSQNGIRDLLDLQRENPAEIYRISRLSPDKQRFEVWNYLKAKALKKPKINTGATPQPESLKENGVATKQYSEMTYAEKKALRQREIWGS